MDRQTDVKVGECTTYRPLLHHSVEHDHAPAFLLPDHLPKVTARVRQRALQTHNPECMPFTPEHTAVRAHHWRLEGNSVLRQTGGRGWDRGPPLPAEWSVTTILFSNAWGKVISASQGWFRADQQRRGKC